MSGEVAIRTALSRALAGCLLIALPALPAAAQGGPPAAPPSDGGFEVQEFRVNEQESRMRTPDVDFDRAGRFVVVWEDLVGGLTARFFQRDRTPLSGDRVLVANDSTRPLPFRGIAHFRKHPDVVYGPGEEFFLFWTEDEEDVNFDFFFGSRDTLDRDVLGQRFTSAGEPVGVAFRVDRNAGFESNPSAAGADNGNVFVVWQEEVAGRTAGIWGRLLGPVGERLAGPFRVDVAVGDEDAGNPAVAVLPGGLALVVWEGCCDDSGDFGIFGRLFDAAGAPLGRAFGINTTTADNQRVPAVSADRAGSFVVVWQSPTGELDPTGVEQWRIYSRLVRRSGPVGREKIASSGLGWGHSSPAVSAGVRGEVFVAWMTWVGDFRVGVNGRRLTTGSGGVGASGADFEVSERGIGGQFRIGAAATPTGRFIVTWEGFSPDGDLGISARLLVPAPVATSAGCGSSGFSPMTATVGCHP